MLRLLGERATSAAAVTAAVTGADRVVRHRVETGHHRQLATIFGTVTVARRAWRASGAPNLYPADAALSLDITGARWGLAGAEAVLKLRAVISCGDFAAYWRYHLDREHQRVHQTRCQDRYALTA